MTSSFVMALPPGPLASSLFRGPYPTEGAALLKLLNETEVAEIADALWVQDTVEMVAFVLDNPGVEAFRLPIDRIAVGIKAPIADASNPGDQSAHTRDAQATLPAVFFVRGERGDFRVHKHGGGHGRGIRIPWSVLDAKHHDPQRDTDLNRRQSGAVVGIHGVPHVGDQAVKLRSIEQLDSGRGPSQPGVANPKDSLYRHSLQPLRCDKEHPALYPDNPALPSCSPQ
jgi:hypothetical protein